MEAYSQMDNNPEITVQQGAHGPVYIMHQHKSGEMHNGYTKGDRVRIKNTDDLDPYSTLLRGKKAR